jgi:diaminohydroxyphosphoribosylaminopyrimidine deaminase/5-amino-6-(5-phosphoribosylamino)uracil reductase
VNALRAAGERARGSTVYVTLEPCNHQGKTPPCTDALIRAGVTRVVYAVDDPNPIALGGAQRLRDAGIHVVGGVLATDAAELNAPFLFAARGATRPFVTLKLATSIDGALVDASRQRGWLTGPAARAEVHRLRAMVDAIAVGAGTVHADDPQLTARGELQPRVAPLRVVFDRGASLPDDSVLVRTAAQFPTVVVSDGSIPENEKRLATQGVSVVHADSLQDALAALREKGVRHLLLEGGATLASAFLAAGLVDRLIIFQAPVILGSGALPAFAAAPSAKADEAPRLRVVSRRELGPDLMTTYAVSKE